jgi:hypothetical protein
VAATLQPTFRSGVDRGREDFGDLLRPYDCEEFQQYRLNRNAGQAAERVRKFGSLRPRGPAEIYLQLQVKCERHSGLNHNLLTTHAQNEDLHHHTRKEPQGNEREERAI